MALGRLKECWDVGYALNNPETWQRLATAALELLDVELALRIYRHLGAICDIASAAQARIDNCVSISVLHGFRRRGDGYRAGAADAHGGFEAGGRARGAAV